jgi:hypothetical protein
MKLYYKLLNKFERVKRFLINSWNFRKELSGYYEFSYDLKFLKRTIELVRDCTVKYGSEEEKRRNKRVDAMNRTIYLLECFIEENFYEIAEKELGLTRVVNFVFEPCEDNPGFSEMINLCTDEEKKDNDIIREHAEKLEKEYWNELWALIKGQDTDMFKSNIQLIDGDDIDDKFDGSGIRGWWD